MSAQHIITLPQVEPPLPFGPCICLQETAKSVQRRCQVIARWHEAVESRSPSCLSNVVNLLHRLIILLNAQVGVDKTNNCNHLQG